jgi:hypothetical protein
MWCFGMLVLGDSIFICVICVSNPLITCVVPYVALYGLDELPLTLTTSTVACYNMFSDLFDHQTGIPAVVIEHDEGMVILFLCVSYVITIRSHNAGFRGRSNDVLYVVYLYHILFS